MGSADAAELNGADDRTGRPARPAGPARPALLVSLHDVSPLTRAPCEQAVALLEACGVAVADLTLFVVPFHEGKTRLDQDPATVRFLRALVDRGARLAMHGLTHRMAGRAWTPTGWFLGHVFARGQGEFFRFDEAETTRRMAQAAEIFRAAGLPQATRAFVPPAWLLSRRARGVIQQAGLDYFETFQGLVFQGVCRPSRVIGWGSLTAVEAWATALYAGWQVRQAPRDTRLAVHPVDLGRPRQIAAIRDALTRLLPRMRPLSYDAYLKQLPAAVSG